MNQESYMRKRVRSFGYAFKGVATLFRTQAHAKIHLVATLAVVGLGIGLGIAAGEWALLVVVIALVWVAEGVNTAIEFVVDLASPEWHDLAGKAKDVAAGAVLLASGGALIVGGIIFLPKIWQLFC